MLKKLLTATLSCALIVSVIGCTRKETKKEDYVSIGMITDVGGINDESFNQSAWEGLLKAKTDLGIGVRYLESNQESDYVTNIDTFIDQDVDLILGVGYAMTEDIYEAAKQYPDRKFALIDGSFEDIPDNVINISFKEEQAGYLAGVLAASVTKTDVIGFLGGIKNPVVDKYKYGFMTGVKDVNSDIVLLEQYANSFTDVSKGRAITEQMIKNKADIVFHAAGSVGNGMFEALTEKGLLGIGVDTDQSSIAPNTVLTSAIKKLDNASYLLAKDLSEGKFNGGTTLNNDLYNDGVGIAKVIESVSSDKLAIVKEYKNKIIKTNESIPETEEEYNKYILNK